MAGIDPPSLPGQAAGRSPLNLTKSQVNKAGRTLRRYLRDEKIPEIEVQRALDVLWEFRAAHQYPLLKANMGLRSAVRSEHCQIEVSQRLKRLRTIMDKLSREPTMALGNMQDIGGCRAVLNSIDEVRKVEHRLKRNREVLGSDDYIKAPRTSGYRGIHLIVGYHDRNGELRAIEVQLRTKVMHEWSIVVERLSGRLQEDLKSGYGPTEVLAWLAVVSKAMAMDERGDAVPEPLLEEIRNRRKAALPYVGERP